MLRALLAKCLSAVSLLGLLIAARLPAADPAPAGPYRLAMFSVDVTIPLRHRCMGILPTKSQRVLDSLQAHGFVLLGPDPPVALLAIDWCELRNGAYDAWRDALASAIGTTRERVLVSALHQHDAPVVDRGAAELLAAAGLPSELYDERFHDDCLRRAAQAAQDSLPHAVTITHLGLGEARVERIASNRRVVTPAGHVHFGRGSRSGADPPLRDAPEGLIDPNLKTLSFWNGDDPVLALHTYATHPMSSYGRGEVSADFVGLARARLQRGHASIRQMYVSGCSGDVTAGKYNDGSATDREQLIERLYQAMVASWNSTRRVPLETVAFRCAPLHLEMHAKADLRRDSLEAALADTRRTVEQRIFAALGLASRRRVEAGQAIDVPCLDFGAAQVVLLPGEAFVGYQLMAQQLRPDSFVVCIGYGECWPGYIPTDAVFSEGFADDWLWVAPGSEARVRAALVEVIGRE